MVDIVMLRERALSAVVGILFVLVFRPYGLSYFPIQEMVIHIFGLFLIILFSCLFCEIIVSKVFGLPDDFAKGKDYTIRRNAIYQVLNFHLIIILSLFYLDRFANNEMVDNHFSWMMVGEVFSVNALCAFIIGLYWRNVYQKRRYLMELNESNRLNGILAERRRQEDLTLNKEMSLSQNPHGALENQHKPEDFSILLTGSTKETVELKPADFLFAESEGNYVSVHYEVKDGGVKKTMLRSTIKDLELAFADFAFVVRCHRAFVVNLKKIESVDSHGSCLMLKMQHTGEEIPVSKTYQQDIKRLIQQPE